MFEYLKKTAASIICNTDSIKDVTPFAALPWVSYNGIRGEVLKKILKDPG